MAEKNKYGYKHNDGHYSKMTGNDKNASYSIYDKNPSEKGHSAIHVNINTQTGKGSIVEHGANGRSTKTDTSCYLTCACMEHFQENFDDNFKTEMKKEMLKANQYIHFPPVHENR